VSHGHEMFGALNAAEGPGDQHMAPPKRPWFRFYVEAFGDRKLRRLKPEHRWLFAACLGAARQSVEPGRLLVGDDPMDVADLADFAGMTERSVQTGVSAFRAAGLVVEHDDGGWFVPAFLRRQYESDSSADRTAKWRRSDSDVTADVTPPETETEDRDKEGQERLSVASPGREHFDAFWSVYPRKEKKGEAIKAWPGAVKKATVELIVSGAERYRDDPNRDPAYTQHPATWLRAECWLDDPLPARGVKGSVGNDTLAAGARWLARKDTKEIA
jgi:hypothetical protein